MTHLARLPKALLIMEARGGLMALSARFDSKALAPTLLMPAAWLMIWRTARSGHGATAV